MNSGSSNRCCTLPAGPKQPRQDSCLTQGSLGPPVSLRGCSASTIVFSRRDCSHRGRGRNKRPLPSAPLMASSASITASASGTRESPAQTTEVLPSLDALSAVDGTSVLSWNVLLPNSQDGWWGMCCLSCAGRSSQNTRIALQYAVTS